jgi:peptide/nickel transport system ATP-binding protein
MGSLPRLDQKAEQLAVIDGVVPDLSALPPGCRFAPRCPFADDACRASRPPVVRLSDTRWSRCFKAPLEGLVPSI